MKINDSLVTRFFIEAKFRILRHLVLVVMICFLTLGMVWYLPPLVVPSYYKIISWLIYTVLIGGIMYINMYIIVPRLYLKNKLGRYTLWLAGATVVGFITMVCVQFFFLQIRIGDGGRGVEALWINVFSALLVFFFLFMGTTTLILVKHRIQSDLEKSELESSLLESELRFLKNQVNPHFLFNMLNNANMLLKKDPKQASEVLFKLEDLLRYQTHETVQQEKVSLGSEIDFLSDYLKLEKLRRDRFEYAISACEKCRNLQVYPLLFIVFVENAVKHNVDPEHPSYVRLSFHVKENRLEFICENSKPIRDVHPAGVGGIGLRNSTRRLNLLYPGTHRLDIREQPFIYTVTLTFSL